MQPVEMNGTKSRKPLSKNGLMEIPKRAILDKNECVVGVEVINTLGVSENAVSVMLVFLINSGTSLTLIDRIAALPAHPMYSGDTTYRHA